jgi:hypothetical protein
MKTPRTTFTALYTGWLDNCRSIFIGRPPAAPAQELTPKAAEVAADQEWEDEGGSIKQAKKPDVEPKPKLPL